MGKTPVAERLQKSVELVEVAAPPADHRRRRAAVFAPAGERRTRYSLPTSLESSSPIGYRTRVALTRTEGEAAMQLLSLERPHTFTAPVPVTEGELFEESSLGLLVARQSTNYRGHRETILGPDQAARVAELLRALTGRSEPVLDNASYVHLVFARPYRTPFTMLLTLVGHGALTSPFGVVGRLWKKLVKHGDDIPSIGALQHLHLGILADAMERAAVVSSQGTRRANVVQSPFSMATRPANLKTILELEEIGGLALSDRLKGWRLALVAQVGAVPANERITLPKATWRKLGANLVSLRSERIQPGVNQEKTAPDQYQQRQEMDVPDELTTQAGRAAYNAFAHWTGVDRERAKELMLLDRIDVLTPNGKERLRAIRKHLNDVTDRVVKNLPLWADLPTGKAFSSNAERGRKAFALAGQRIYIGGLAAAEIQKAGIDWELAVRAVGAASSRAALYSELCGLTNLPDDCDLLAGTCLMAGPVNQNDVGKAFFGAPDLLAETYAGRDPTALLVWTLKAKTVADPIGNEEQLMNASRKGALVDLRPGPHEVIRLSTAAGLLPMRSREGRVNTERAFGDVGNFVTDPEGRGIPGNRGAAWPETWSSEVVWPVAAAHAGAVEAA